MVNEWRYVVQGILAFLSTSLNAFVLYSIYRRRLYIKTTDIFIAHLAVADILVGLKFVPSLIQKINHAFLPYDFWTCLSMYTIYLMINNNAINMLMCVTVDRFFAVRFPLHYMKIIDTTTANRVLLVVWAVSIVTGTVPWFWNNGSEKYSRCEFIEVISRSYLVYYNFFFLNGIPLVAIMCSYIYINTVMRRIKRMDRQLRSRFAINTTQSPRKYRGPVLLMSVVVVLILPVHIMDTLFYFEVLHTQDHYTILLSFVMLKNCTSIINPFIYASHYFFKNDKLTSTFVTSTSRTKDQSSSKLFSSRSTPNANSSKFSEIDDMAPTAVSDFSKQNSPIPILSNSPSSVPSSRDSVPTPISTAIPSVRDSRKHSLSE